MASVAAGHGHFLGEVAVVDRVVFRSEELLVEKFVVLLLPPCLSVFVDKGLMPQTLQCAAPSPENTTSVHANEFFVWSDCIGSCFIGWWGLEGEHCIRFVCR